MVASAPFTEWTRRSMSTSPSPSAVQVDDAGGWGRGRPERRLAAEGDGQRGPDLPGVECAGRRWVGHEREQEVPRIGAPAGGPDKHLPVGGPGLDLGCGEAHEIREHLAVVRRVVRDEASQVDLEPVLDLGQSLIVDEDRQRVPPGRDRPDATAR